MDNLKIKILQAFLSEDLDIELLKPDHLGVTAEQRHNALYELNEEGYIFIPTNHFIKAGIGNKINSVILDQAKITEKGKQFLKNN